MTGLSSGVDGKDLGALTSSLKTLALVWTARNWWESKANEWSQLGAVLTLCLSEKFSLCRGLDQQLVQLSLAVIYTVQ